MIIVSVVDRINNERSKDMKEKRIKVFCDDDLESYEKEYEMLEKVRVELKGKGYKEEEVRVLMILFILRMWRD